MAVYKQSYRGYAGGLTPAWSRFLILYRIARKEVFHSKALLGFFFTCLTVPLGYIAFVYVAHNALAEAFLHLSRYVPIDRSFFYSYVHTQGVLAFLLVAFAGPGLIAPDLAHGGLVLYLARPLSRLEYLLGKMSVLVVLLLEMTLLPGVLLFGVQATLAGGAWRAAHWWILGSMALGFMAWILLLSLLTLAVSAWVRWKVVAGAAMLGILFFGAGFATAINLVLRTKLGYILDLPQLMEVAWSDLFRLPGQTILPLSQAWAMLLLVGAAALLLVWRKLRPFEVVK